MDKGNNFFKLILKIIEIVNKHDNKCFMVTNIVADVHGQGFTFESGRV